jgi:hypothetical protein
MVLNFIDTNSASNSSKSTVSKHKTAGNIRSV